MLRDPEFWFIFGGLAFVILLLVGLWFSDQRLMEQCLADGRKEYECSAMLRGGGGTVIIPTFK